MLEGEKVEQEEEKEGNQIFDMNQSQRYNWVTMVCRISKRLKAFLHQFLFPIGIYLILSLEPSSLSDLI